MARKKKTVEHSADELLELERQLKRYVDMDRLIVVEPALELRQDFVRVLNDAFKRQEGIIDFEDAKALRRKARWQKKVGQQESQQASQG